MPQIFFFVASSIALITLSFTVNAATVYSNSALFFESVNTYLTDDYQSSGYSNTFGGSYRVFYDMEMSAVFGETKYRSIRAPNTNIVGHEIGETEAWYCAGCNGSFELDFTETSIGNAAGVYAVGFNIVENTLTGPYYASVTYGNSTTENFSLPVKSWSTLPTTFWGISSSSQIRSIQLLASRNETFASFAIDNLTIASPIPIPPALWLFGSALGVMGWMRRKIGS